MSPAFVAIAALLALAAVAAVALPLVLRRPRPGAGSAGGAAASGSAVEPPAAPLAAAVAAFLVLGGAAGLYATWSNWTWPAAGQEGVAATPADMVSKLARRLEQQPQDVDGWLMLGRSYAALGQYPLAVRAYQRADRLENGRNVEALTGWAEALALSNEAELEGRAGQLFERALALEPTSPKALFFGAVAAQRRGELPLALQRFETMLAGGPPENVRPLLEQQVAMLKAAMAGAAPAAPGASPGATAGSPAIRVQVRVAPAIASRVPAGAPLFVFVRVPGQPGPPLAVKRLAATLPQLVELTPADAMMGGNGFAAGDEVEVTARVALGGQPTASTGDPFGLVSYDVGRDGEKELVIDRLTP
ncbi:MAG: hypothetical protein MUF07_03995 [Steroidobacteraceae bacterium]|jgi:cytochrome c-type biogenesis protein CcmH|nr:hypothetical protein [Steroidobacteraceae bacterium]